MKHHRDEFDAMLETLAKSASEPEKVAIGKFAEAVQAMRAELRLIEGQIDLIDGAIRDTFSEDAAGGARENGAARRRVASAQTAANKP